MDTKICVVCHKSFIPGEFTSNSSNSQRCCSVNCAINLVQATNGLTIPDKSFKSNTVKDKKYWVRRLDYYFNIYIRKRDKDNNCISCGKKSEQYHAGHFIAKSNTYHNKLGLRWDEYNVNKQCVRCNIHLHGNLLKYRRGLVEKIGEEKVIQLEDFNTSIDYSLVELEEMVKEIKLRGK